MDCQGENALTALQAIQRLKRGDPGALELLMARYQVQAARAAFLIRRDRALTEEVIQETFTLGFGRQVAGI